MLKNNRFYLILKLFIEIRLACRMWMHSMHRCQWSRDYAIMKPLSTSEPQVYPLPLRVPFPCLFSPCFLWFWSFWQEHIIPSVSVSLKFIALVASWPHYFTVGLQKLLLLHNWNWNSKYHISTSLTMPKAGTLSLATVCSRLLWVYCFRVHINMKPWPLYSRRTHIFY